MEDIQKAIELLKKYNKERVLKELEKNKDTELIKQILNIDFEQIKSLEEKIEKQEQYENRKIESIAYVDEKKLTKEERERYFNIGKNIISQGKYAVVTMAGGQRNKAWT